MSSIICKTVQTFESLASKILPLSRLYMYPYKKIVQKEIQLAETQPKMHVLQIGAGSVPYTAMYLAQMGDLYVTAVDRDTSAVKCAKEWIRRMGISDRVDVLCTNGNDYPLSNISAVFIALQVEPKDQVMDYVMDSGRQGLKVIVREPSERYSFQYDPIPAKWTPVSQIYQGMPTFTYSNLYIKA